MIKLYSDSVYLEDITDSASTDCVLDEVRTIMAEAYPGMIFPRLLPVFNDVVSIYKGEYPGYRGCTTGYHDLRHIMDAFLAMARMLHGSRMEGVVFKSDDVMIGLISVLLHDIGYIQSEEDTEGTGAKYTATHVERSIEFARGYLLKSGFRHLDVLKVSQLIYATSLSADSRAKYDTEDLETLGKMISAADLAGQMADRAYLEKLRLLYLELLEGRAGEYQSEDDLFKRTVDFVEHACFRILGAQEDFHRYLRTHFRKRCNLDHDLYTEAIGKNASYLLKILSEGDGDFRSRLNRTSSLAA